MAPTTTHPGTTINERAEALQGRDLFYLFLSTTTHEMGYARDIANHFDKIYHVEDRIYSYRSLTGANIMTAIANHPGIEWVVQNESPLLALLSDLRDLLKEENEDDYGILR